MSKTFYVTSPIYYVNDKPHIGHAYTSVACDILARAMRMFEYEVFFLTGTDEHGLKIEKTARSNKIDTKEFVDQVSLHFKEMNTKLNISNDDFIRTTEERHKETAQKVWTKLKENGTIYLDKYSGWYAVRDEAYYAETELVNGKAPTGADVEWIEEPSYFFNLSKWGDRLLELYEKNPNFIQPDSRKNEIINFVKYGLKDLSISRTTFKWGVPVPNDPNHVMYVWLDALTNYLSGIGYCNNEELFNKFWPANVHMIGKDITRFHTIYWPAFLMALDLPVPEKVFAHGWWKIEGEKMSKSLNNVVSPIDMVDKFGVDQVRWFMFRGFPFGNDCDFCNDKVTNMVNSDLADNIGNLVHRSLSMIIKNCSGKVPSNNYNQIETDDNEFINKLYNIDLNDLENKFRNCQFYEIANDIMTLSTNTNCYMNIKAPWKLRKENNEKMEYVLYNVLEAVRHIGIMSRSFIPRSADIILDYLKVPVNERTFCNLKREYALNPGNNIENNIVPVFQKF